jgi:hypothetical protein
VRSSWGRQSRSLKCWLFQNLRRPTARDFVTSEGTVWATAGCSVLNLALLVLTASLALLVLTARL